MRCAACGFENASGIKFCGECGAPLKSTCASCGFENAPGIKFCGECGKSLTEASQSALTSHSALEGERKQLTVLFCDLVGSTELSSRLDPEDWRETVRRYQDVAAGVIERHGGHVAQYLGDGLLVYFGYPRAHDDDAERAIRAGLGLVDVVGTLDCGPPLAVRVGIHTGTVVVGDMGGSRHETLALGETPNVAARLQGLASPQTVVISRATFRLVPGLFVTEPLGAQEIKGLSVPVEVHRVVEQSGVRSRLDAAAGRLTPFVGRNPELATLVERWERAAEGEGQNVLVVGEAGVGKSRLVYELRARLASVPHTWLECRATPYAEATPFYPVVELLKQGLDFAPEDTAAEKLGKLERGLRLARLDSLEAIPLMAEFLSLATPEILPSIEMYPETRRRKTLELLVAWNLALAEEQPLIVLVEDLHWCDQSSLELFGRLIAQSPMARVLLVGTARPEFSSPWPARSNLTTLQLARLTRRQAREMVAALGGNALPTEMVDTLVAHSDGVPLFVEELTKAVVEPGSGREVNVIPVTLADSLMSRLDRLSTAKEVAQRTAVLGREFSYALALATAGLEEPALRRGLQRLIEAEIVFARGEPPAALYTFKHVLVQEAAYESLLRSTRRELHARVVHALLERFPDRVVTEPELVARHAEAAGLLDEAVTYLERAGAQAQARAANQEAITHLKKALALLRTRPGHPGRSAREAKLEMALGNSLTAIRGFEHAELAAAFERARALADAGRDKATLALALAALVHVYLFRGEPDRAMDLGEQALKIAQESGNQAGTLTALESTSHVALRQGRFAIALARAEQAIALYDPVRDRMPWYGGNQGVSVLGRTSFCLFELGQADRALAWAREATVLARTLDHPFSLANALYWEATVHQRRREIEAQRERAREVIGLSEAHGFPYFLGCGRMIHGQARVLSGEGTAALTEITDGMALLASIGDQMNPGHYWQLAVVQFVLGQIAEALQTVERGLDVATQTGTHYCYAALCAWKGWLLLRADSRHADEAEALFHCALDIARPQEARFQELFAARCLATLRRAQGKPAEGRAILEPVYRSFTEGFEIAELKEAKAQLEKLSLR